MDLKSIAAFIKVADLGSFSKAAAVIGINQPSVGRQVRKLEQECGKSLFHRNGRGVVLTPEGLELVEKLRPLIVDIEGVVTAFKADASSPRGEVTLALTPTIMSMSGYQIFKTVASLHPGIHLNIVTGYSGYISEWLTGARVDIAVLHDSRRSSQILATPLMSLPLCLVSAEGKSGFDAGDSVAFDALHNLPLVIASRNHGLRRSLESAAAGRNIKVRIVHEIDSFDLMKEIAIKGDAHTVLAAAAVTREIAHGTLVAKQIVDPEISTDFVMASAANRPRTIAVRAVEDVIVEILRRDATPY
ncbi:LysR family transcriptional regulator [Bordetella petrii]|uniref:LysR family transcriptional regulator n=1 Tax=Bordetella petrii TaxID=94624 RepID=UPI001E37F9C8|nr:LysR family transcriptional regulator [Bordetella petrii]MCD0502305.1 LysR family transcriptional regulator [Bordetella petrii]